MAKKKQETKHRKARWDVILTNEEISMLNKGIDPRLIQPDHLVEYWPLREEVKEGE